MTIFKRSILAKILGTVVVITAVGFGALIYMVMSYEKSSLLEERKNSSRLMAEPVLKSIYEDMLNERADMARHLVEDIKKIKGTERVQIIRSKGEEEAFQDFKTLKAVEKEYGKLKPEWVEGHPDKGKNIADGVAYPEFKKAVRLFNQGRKEEISYIEGFGNKRFLTYLAPIEARPKCNACHATAGEARGVLMISVSLEDMDAAIASSRARWMTYGFFTVAAVSLLLAFLIRNIVKPLKRMTSSAKEIAGGNFSISIPVHTEDEVGALSRSFNKMAAELEAAKKELDKRILELYTLYNVSKALSTSFEMEELMKRIVDNVSRSLNIDRVMVMLIDDQTGELYVASCTDFIGEDLDKKRFKIGEGLYGFAAIDGRPRLITDVERGQAVTRDERFDDDISSIIIIPFGVRGKTLGLLNVFKNKPDVFGEEDVELLMAVAEHVALALENAKLYKETKLLAITDGLTGLYNHRFFVEKLKAEISRAERYGHPLSLVMLDIDWFKHYNDAHGHQMGDVLLRQLAELLKQGLRSMDFVARYGGEEFVIILPETDKAGAAQMAERIRRSVEEYHFLLQDAQPEGNLTVSLGVASFEGDVKDIDGFVKKADDALYRAKDSGRNRVVSA